MPLRLLLALGLLLLVAAELYTIVAVAGGIGVLPTLLLLVGLGLAGMALIRRQGLATLARVQAQLQAGRPPVAEVFEGMCLLVAGLLLALPGLLTDVAGIALLLPPVRRLLYKALSRRLGTVGGPVARGGPRPGSRPGPGRGRPGPDLIEGEYEEIGPAPVEPPRHQRP